MPQGSVLGPLLFCLYVNDLSVVSDLFDSLLYADDTTLTYSPDKSLPSHTISENINKELQIISDWFRANKLSLNLSKTNYMIFHTPRVVPSDFNLIIDGVKIHRVVNFKFLGLCVNETLKWGDHIKFLSLKLSRAVGVMGRLRSILPHSTLLTLYHSFVSCHLNNNLILWGKHCNEISIFQKRAIRIICGKPKFSHSTPLFKLLNILKISDLYGLHLLKFYYRFINSTLPDALCGLNLRENCSFHGYMTRNRHKLSVPVHKHSFFQLSITYSLVSFINTLNSDIKDKIKTHSLQNIISRFKNDVINSYDHVCHVHNCYVCGH